MRHARWLIWMLVACAPTDIDDRAGTPAVDTDIVDAPDTDVDDGPAIELGSVRLPFGETLFLDGDDYLAAWATLPGPTELTARPDGATAGIVGDRLTPDVPGIWRLERRGEVVEVEVDADFLEADTFLNYNYSPVSPLLDWGDGTVWVASPPSNAVQPVTVSPTGMTTGALVDVGAWPVALARWGDLLLVSQAGRDSLGFVDPVEGRLVDAIRVGDEPAGIVVDGDVAWVALSGPGKVARVDLVAREVTNRIPVGREPKAVAFDPVRRRLFVASQLSSNAHPRGPVQVLDVPEDQQHDVHVIDVDAGETVGTLDAVGTILRGLLVDGDRLLVAASDSRNHLEQVNAESHPHDHQLVVADLDTLTITERVDLGEHPSSGGPVASPFSMVRQGDSIWVAASAGQVLVQLDAVSWTERSRVEVGHDPRGLLALGDGADSLDLLTFPWLSEEVVRVHAFTDRVEVGRDPTPDDVRLGQQLFSNAEFSRYGEFSCNNCHIDGVNDGLTWDLLLDGPVNTLPFRNIGGTGPFLWGGFLPTLFDFSREVLRLVGAEATGEQMELLNAYMQSITAPPNPHTLPGGALTPAGARGRTLFEGSAGCAGCHPAPLFTNQTVVPGKTDNLATDVPSLIGAWDSGPWGRQGQWVTLDAMIEAATAYTGAELSDTEKADLVAYVRQIPADALYVTSVTPLDGADHVFQGSSVEVAFSGLLAEGQEAAFTFERHDGTDWQAVAGGWTVSGRYARFDADRAQLRPETDYRITVADGLTGALGTTLSRPMGLSFSTGTAPATDVSGSWRLSASGVVDASFDIGFVQGRGGQVTGARTGPPSSIDFDHVQGFVSGDTFIADDFEAVIFGLEVQVDHMELALYDDDGDGFAERGEGLLESGYADLDISMTRTALPGAN